jgi:hypothetical protein
MYALRVVAVVVSTLFVGAAWAQSSTSKPDDKMPMTQGAASVDKNLERDPDNKGLKNAGNRIKRNQERFEDRRDKRADRREDRVERAERAERPERAEHAERPDRAERSGR